MGTMGTMIISTFRVGTLEELLGTNWEPKNYLIKILV